ncbi:MAG TPA: hypothetical protein VGR50_06380 [Terriglobales bacterium]|nr:hypothetical protein [Terriglobales bacterium]
MISSRIALLLFAAIAVPPASAQQSEAPPASKTQVKVNYLNVCGPSDSEQRELGAALAKLPLKTSFAPDFEISRGRTTLSEPPVKLAGLEEAPDVVNGPSPISSWVRLRREFPASSPLVSVQYSLSVDEKNIVETLVFRSREAKDVIETSLEDKVSAVADPSQVLKSDTPVDRIRIERFGKPSVVLARCAGADQKTYEPLFSQGSQVMTRYRTLLGVRQTALADLRRLGIGPSPGPQPRPSAKKKAAQPPALAPK